MNDEEDKAIERIDFLKGLDRNVEGLRKHAERLRENLTPKERAILEKRTVMSEDNSDSVFFKGEHRSGCGRRGFLARSVVYDPDTKTQWMVSDCQGYTPGNYACGRSMWVRCDVIIRKAKRGEL